MMSLLTGGHLGRAVKSESTHVSILGNVSVGQGSSGAGGWQQCLQSKAERLVAEIAPLVDS
jgi:hypothetical protein